MVGGRALPESAKSRARRFVDDLDMEKALNLCRAEKSKPKGQRRAVACIARSFNIKPSTLAHRLAGRRSVTDYAKTRKHLHESEEVVLVQHIQSLARRGLPATHKAVKNKAEAILLSRTGKDVKLGANWATDFLEQHPELQVYRSTPLDKARANGLNPTTVKEFEDIVEKVFTDVNPVKGQIYGADETGCLLGVGGSQVVIGERGNRNQHSQEDGNRELVTSLVTICADGTKTTEIIIFRGKNLQQRWAAVNPGGLRFTVSGKAYMNQELGLAYIQDFDEQTKWKGHEWRILFVDGHNSHCTVALLEYAVAHNIIVISYPPHCTHGLQGLDVAAFGCLKNYWGQERDNFEKETGLDLTKEYFLRVYHLAALRAFTPDTISSAFSATGVWPRRRGAVTEKQMAPSLVTSTKGSFPLQMSTPVKRIMEVYRDIMASPHGSDLDGDVIMDDILAQAQASPHAEPGFESPIVHPQSPSFAIRTPTKRQRRRALFKDTTSIFVYSTTPSKKRTTRLPKAVVESMPLSERPDFDVLEGSSRGGGSSQEVARLRKELERAEAYIGGLESINEGAQAQLLLQEIHNGTMAKHLYAKDSKKVKKGEIRLTGKDARIWTDETFLGELRRVEGERGEKAAAKVTRKSLTQLRRRRATWRKIDVERRKINRAKDLLLWEADVDAYTAMGGVKKYGPKRPKALKAPPLPDFLLSPAKRPHADVNDPGDDDDSEESPDEDEGDGEDGSDDEG